MGNKKRCSWCNEDLVYKNYHDNEWGKLNLDENYLFEMLILEGQQAGLSWITILKKREEYKKVFCDFDYKKISKFSDEKLEKILRDEKNKIIKNKLKIYSIKKNAILFLKVQKEFESFKSYLMTFTKNKIYQHFDLVENEMSILISKDLKKRGFNFVGPKIIYSYLEAIGIYNNHTKNCYLYKKI